MAEPRWKSYQNNMDDILGGISAEETAKIIQAKVLDFISKDFSSLKDYSMEELRRRIGSLFAPAYVSFVDKSISNYDGILNLVNAMYSDLGDDLARNTPTIITLEQITQDKFGDYEETEIKRIQRSLSRHLRSGVTVTELQDKLSTISRRVRYYSESLAKTQIKAFGREGKNEKSRIADVEWFQYVGAHRPNKIRSWCEVHLNGYYSLKELSEMDDNLQIGQIKPVRRYCGGWNCVHDFEPDPDYKEK